jgi:hypothetical protein
MEEVIAAATVPAAYATLMDLGVNFVRKGLQVVNGLNAAIQLRFASGDAGDNVVTIQAGATREFQGLRCFGILEYQYAAGAPTTGLLTVSVW